MSLDRKLVVLFDNRHHLLLRLRAFIFFNFVYSNELGLFRFFRSSFPSNSLIGVILKYLSTLLVNVLFLFNWVDFTYLNVRVVKVFLKFFFWCLSLLVLRSSALCCASASET